MADVSYTAIIQLKGLVYPSTRIILSMPPSLTFDESFGCVVTYTPAKCEVNYETNELTLSEIFDSAVVVNTNTNLVMSWVVEMVIFSLLFTNL